jgi:hypothetical protein
MTATIASPVRLRQRFTDGPPVNVAPQGVHTTGDPGTDALLALAVVVHRLPHPDAYRDFTYEALDESGVAWTDERDPIVLRLRAALEAAGDRGCGIEAQQAALESIGL